MKVLLIDADSIIANLALMKLSAWHKKQGDEVKLLKLDGKRYNYNPVFEKYDKVYCSIIFDKNKGNVTGKDIIFGGVGHALESKLEEEIEHIMPDYSIYPDNEYSMGFLTRGCIRKCGFCIVPRKEGLIHKNADLSEFYNPNLKYIMCLDNNILSYSKWKEEFEKIIATGKLITFKQGMDFRLITEEKAEWLKKLKYKGEYIFAFDNYDDYALIKRNMDLCRKYFNNWEMKFFVLIGFNSTLQQDIERVAFLKNNQCLTYIMPFEKVHTSPNKIFYLMLKNYCNSVCMYKKINIVEFIDSLSSSKREKIYDIINKNNVNFNCFDELKDFNLKQKIKKQATL